MKKINLLVALLLITFLSYSQSINYYPGHPSYNTGQLLGKNCIEVQPNGSLIYVGYRNSGLHIFEPATNSWVAYDATNSNIPSSNVSAIKIKSGNQLWLGTYNGLSIFDGTNFTNYNKSNSSILSDTIICLYAVPTGVWIGTRFGLSFFNGSTFTNYTTQNSGLVSNDITCIEQDSSGNFYFGTLGGISYYDNSNWYNSTKANSSLLSDTIRSINYVSSKACWIYTLWGMCKLDNGNFVSFIDSSCTYPRSFEPYFNAVYAPAKKNNFLYFLLPVGLERIAKIHEDNTITGFNDSLILGAVPAGTYAKFDNNGILWILGRVNTSMVLASFNESISTGNFNLFGTQSRDEMLNTNQVITTIQNRGDMFWDLSNQKYEVPRCTEKHSIFAGGLWLGGYDQNNILHTSAMTYRQNNSYDYWPGPLDTISGTTDVTTVNAFDNIWKFEKDTINAFITNFLNGNVSNGSYPIPFDILTYPGVGTGNFSRNLAPFVDYNNDGNYNPYNGDYPRIKGDQFLYWIFNDNDTLHTETNGLPLGVEIHGSAYAYNCPQFTINDPEGVLNYTTFYNFEIYNRSSNSYDSVYIGLWTDTDLGDYSDDYVGCDSTSNIGFCYNGDNDDGAGTAIGYGLNPPMINCQILKGPEPDLNDGIDNDHDGTIDEVGETNMMSTFMTYENINLVPTGNPAVADDYYQYISGYWCDGTRITYGGNGYNTFSTNYTSYMFSGTPYSGSGWSENIGFSNPAGDRRMILSSGPFSLAPGQMKSIDYAMVFTWDSTAANGLNTSIAKNIVGNQKIKQWFDAGVLGNCNLLSANNAVVPLNSFQVFPNPAEDVLQLVTNFNSSTPSSYIVTDITGRTVAQNKFIENIEISIQHLSPSVYLVTVTNGNYVLTRKFVKH